jgi:hypothetical protein
LGFGIPLLPRLILLAFSMLILLVMGLIERELLARAIFLDLFLFVGQLSNSLLSHNQPQSQSM